MWITKAYVPSNLCDLRLTAHSYCLHCDNCQSFLALCLSRTLSPPRPLTPPGFYSFFIYFYIALMHFACVHQYCERQRAHWSDGLYKELTGWDRLLVGSVGLLEISTLIMNYCHCSSSVIVCMHFLSLTQPRRKLTFSIISELSPHDKTLVPIRCVQMYLFDVGTNVLIWCV